jgi:protein phosphatase
MGCVRTNNEDNFAYDPVNDLYVVCDGMGGMAAGEVASAIACGTVLQVFAAQPPETPVLTKLALAIRKANDAVRESSQQNHEQHGMGTTLVAAVIEGNKAIVGNVGDSRAYLIQNAVCVQLTVDHSYINELVRNGTVKVEDIHSVNLKGLESVITRAIGAADMVDPDFFAVDLRENDALLLASDGLTRYVNSANINSMIDPQDLEGSCQRLVQAAKDAGGADNITCLLLRYNAPIADQVPVSEQPIHTSVEEPAAEPVVEASTDSSSNEIVFDPAVPLFLEEPSPEAEIEPVAGSAPEGTEESPSDTPTTFEAKSDPEAAVEPESAIEPEAAPETESQTEPEAPIAADAEGETAPERPAEENRT